MSKLISDVDLSLTNRLRDADFAKSYVEALSKEIMHLRDLCARLTRERDEAEAIAKRPAQDFAQRSLIAEVIELRASRHSDVATVEQRGWDAAIEAAAKWHDERAAIAKTRYEELQRHSDDPEEQKGWRSWKEVEDRHRHHAAAILQLKRPT